MTAVVTRLPTAATAYSGAQLALIRRTVAADCNDAEFDLFCEVAHRSGLDPFRKQIMALVFSKNDPAKRRMSIVTGIDGLRAIADRSGTYSPDDEEPQFTYDEAAKDPACNPLGLVKAKVSIFKAGKRVPGVAYWDEFAPIREEASEGYDWVETGEVWPDTGKPKKRKVAREGSTLVRTLDTSGQWGKMGRTMLAKCAEAQALRKAYPEDTSGLYERSELDQAQAIELTASEVIESFNTEARLARVGGPAIIMQFGPQQPLERVAVGQLADRIMAEVEGFGGVQMLDWFESANTQPLRDFWAHNPTDALEVKKALAATRERLLKAEATVE